MITLHGFSSSNYYNIVKHVLLYKDIPFREDLIYGGGDEWLQVSPVGKVPAITTEDGRHLSESSVICDFLEDAYPLRPLYPADAGERGAVRQIMKVSELYMELPTRRLIAYAFSGKTAPDSLQEEVRHVLQRGIGAMQRLCQFSPWIAGDELTMADIYVHYANSVVRGIGSTQLDWDILAEIPGMKEWTASMRESAIARRVEDDRVANEPDFHAYVSKFLTASPGKR